MISKLITTSGEHDIVVNGKKVYNSKWKGNYNGKNLDLDYVENGKLIEIKLNNKHLLDAVKKQINEDRESPLIDRLNSLNTRRRKIRNRTPTHHPKKTSKAAKKKSKSSTKKVTSVKEKPKKKAKSKSTSDNNKKLKEKKKHYNHSH